MNPTPTATTTAPLADAATAPAPDPVALDRLRQQVDGVVLTPGDAGYDDATSAWNRATRHRPAVVVAAAQVGDVVAAVRFATAHQLGLGVQATGHGMARPADGGVLVLTGGLDQVVVDPEARTAWVGGGSTWGPVLEQAQRHGLAPLLGSAPHVGAVGYTLGGGFGWLTRRFGAACDSARSFEVVTADGRLVRASTDENPELFRALRGGGGGALGVVTGMEVQLYPVTTVYGGDLLYPAAQAEEVISRWAEWVADAPDELTSEVVCMNFPPLPELPDAIRGQSFTIVRGCWAGDLEAGHAHLEAWKAQVPPLVDMWRDMPFAEVASISNDPVDPLPAASSGGWLARVDGEVARAVAERTFPAGGPPTLMFTEVRHVGGAALARGDRATTVLGNRDLQFAFHTVGVPMGELGPDAIRAHIAGLKAAMGDALTDKVYLNFVEGEERRSRTADALDEAGRAATRAAKAAVDGNDLFRYGVAY